MIYFVAIIEVLVLLVALRALSEYLERSSKVSQHQSSIEGRLARLEKREYSMVQAVFDHVRLIEHEALGWPEHKILK
jgi:hypothetical protein